MNWAQPRETIPQRKVRSMVQHQHIHQSTRTSHEKLEPQCDSLYINSASSRSSYTMTAPKPAVWAFTILSWNEQLPLTINANLTEPVPFDRTPPPPPRRRAEQASAGSATSSAPHMPDSSTCTAAEIVDSRYETKNSKGKGALHAPSQP